MKAEMREVEKCNQEIKFPCLMKHKYSDLVILMCEEGTGMVVVFGGKWTVGHYSSDWNMDNFAKLPNDRQIILEND